MVDRAQVERSLRSHPDVVDAVAVAVNGAAAERVVGVIVPRPGADPMAEDLGVDAEVVTVDRIPVAADGGPDRQWASELAERLLT